MIETRDIGLPDFGNGNGNTLTIADDLTSNFDESMSVISDDDSQLFDPSAPQIDDIFPEVAEEAIEVDEVQITKRQLKLLERNINALSATLSNFNVIVSSNNGKSNVTGYALTVNVAEELNVPLKNIFDKHRAPSTMMADKTTSPPPVMSQYEQKDRSFKDAQLQFTVSAEGVGADKYAHVIAKIRELAVSLDEQIVSYLGPFVRDDSQEEDPLFLELNIEDSKIHIVVSFFLIPAFLFSCEKHCTTNKDVHTVGFKYSIYTHCRLSLNNGYINFQNPKRKNPLRIRVGDIKIEDGEERKF